MTNENEGAVTTTSAPDASSSPAVDSGEAVDYSTQSGVDTSVNPAENTEKQDSSRQVEPESNIDEASRNDNRSERRGNPEFARDRIRKRELKQSMALQEQRIKQLETELERFRTPAQPEVKKPKPDMFSDPEGYERYILEQAEQRAEKLAEDVFQTRTERYQSRSDAYNWLLSQKGVSPEVESELNNMLVSDERLQRLMKKEPQMAAEVLWSRYQSQGRKVDPIAKARAAGVRTSPAAPAQGKTQWSMDKINKFYATASEKEISEKEGEINDWLKATFEE